MKANQILLASRPKGMPKTSDFYFEETNLPDLMDGEVLVKALYISVDPYMRGRMNDQKSYVAPFKLNEPLNGGVVAEIVESRTPAFQKGDTILGMLPWATYSVLRPEGLQKLDISNVSPSYYLGILGMPGLTAYFGVTKICNPKLGETFVVSGAAGAVGTVAGQIAKKMGCHVVGIAGTDEKAQLLKNKFGFDEVINYKTSPNLSDAVAAACPDGVDCYFDNVGGDITDAVVAHINFNARIALCGQIALYNDDKIAVGWRLLPAILMNSALIKGYIVNDYREEFPQAQQQLTQWLKEGKLHYTETIIEGFDQLPAAFMGLFSGMNTGKMVVKI